MSLSGPWTVHPPRTLPKHPHPVSSALTALLPEFPSCAAASDLCLAHNWSSSLWKPDPSRPHSGDCFKQFGLDLSPPISLAAQNLPPFLLQESAGPLMPPGG